MIVWSRVLRQINGSCEEPFPTIKDALEHLYVCKQLSLTQLSIYLGLSYTAVRVKIKSLGLQSRPRGGANRTMGFQLTDEEYEMSYKEVAKRHRISYDTVRRARRCYERNHADVLQID